MRILTALLFAISFFAAAQTPQVPHKMSFAGMTLTIRDDARREIQKDVDALTLSPKHFNIKAERAKTYFPIIEKIFAEEGVPDDFKYLVLQESALIPDAVSVSNAVGFWQFKDFTAVEVGLRVDKHIDERMNIASSTRGAARYIKKNNTFFNNWLYALQAYQMGAGGVMKSVKNTHSGETQAEISSATYWYVKKFLAHKIAFEEGIKGEGATNLLVYESKNRKTLSDFAKEVSVDEVELRNYNKWTKSGDIPDDRTYVVVIPVASGSVTPSMSSVPLASSTQVPAPIVAKTESVKRKVNGVLVIQAITGETPAKLATRAGVDLAAFLKWNDISYSTAIASGTFYFLGKKRVRAEEDYYTLQPGENLWDVSQRYGVQIKKLKKYNRLQNQSVKPGTTLWLSSMKPRSATNEPMPTEVIRVNEKDTFSWTANPEEDITSVNETPIAPADVTETINEAPANKIDSVKNLQPVIKNVDPVDTMATIKVEAPIVKKTEHVVGKGETLYAIAKQYNVGVMELVSWNNLDLQQGIKPGQILKLSENQPITQANAETSVEIMHEVKPSDTLYSIARKYGVTIKDLTEWNQKKDFALTVGEKLRIKQAQ
jgi:membrane-bound lytic murein transglycosylase D